MSAPNRSAVIFDIDGTLANADHRRHLVDHVNYQKTMPKNWVEFKRLSSFDPVIEPVLRLLRVLWKTNHVVLCTGRDTDQKQQTIDWLQSKGIPYSALYMRTAGDYRADNIVKRELLDQINELYDPWIVVDDRQCVVDMWRAAGLVCLQCAPGNF